MSSGNSFLNSNSQSIFLSDWSQSKLLLETCTEPSGSNTTNNPVNITSTNTNTILEVVQELMTHLTGLKQDLESIKSDLESRSQEITPNLLILLIRQNQEIMLKLEGQKTCAKQQPAIRCERETQTNTVDQCNIGAQTELNTGRELMPLSVDTKPLTLNSDTHPLSPLVIPEDEPIISTFPTSELGTVEDPIQVESLFSERKSRPPSLLKKSQLKPSLSQVKVKQEMVSMKSMRFEPEIVSARQTRSAKRFKK